MLSEIIRDIGICRVAKACGVYHRSVVYWCERERLPGRQADAARRAHYERCIAKLAGMKVGELRKRIAESEAAKAA